MKKKKKKIPHRTRKMCVYADLNKDKKLTRQTQSTSSTIFRIKFF